jgi:hypothetical protein
VRRGEYFVSTGEVLLPSVKFEAGITVRAEARWTFPLAQAVVVSGDGASVNRHVIALEDTPSHGSQTFTWKAPGGNARWARLEIWDVAGNGAFSIPVRFAGGLNNR